MTDEHNTTNLDQPPQDRPYDDPMFDPPPAWPKVVGIISIVLASIGLACGLIGVGSSVFFLPAMHQGMRDQFGSVPPSMLIGPLDYLHMATGTATTILLLIAGVATVTRKANGRSLHILYGLLGVVIGALGIVLHISKHLATAQWVQDNIDDPAMQAQFSNPMSLIIGLAFGAVLGLGWPLFCLLWFGALGKRPEVGKPEVL